MLKNTLLGTLILLGAVASCGDKSPADSTHNMPPEGIYENAPSLVTVTDRDFTLSAYVWRDFMPMTTPESSGLMAVIRINAADSMPFPQSLELTQAWLYSGESVWAPSFAEPARIAGSQLEQTVRKGPLWKPGEEVDILVLLTEGDESHYLRTSGIAIQETH